MFVFNRSYQTSSNLERSSLQEHVYYILFHKCHYLANIFVRVLLHINEIFAAIESWLSEITLGKLVDPIILYEILIYYECNEGECIEN